MPDKLFLNAEDVVKIMGVAKPTAYKLMQRLNSELAKKGYITIQGKVPTKYFFLNAVVLSKQQNETGG